LLLLENWNREARDASLGCPFPLAHVSADGVPVRLPCKRRLCPVCGVRYRAFVQARMFKGLEGGERVSLLVVTRPGGDWTAEDLASYNADSPRRLKALLRSLRRAYPGLSYFWTAELQRNGSVHFNVLLRSLPFVRLDAMRPFVVDAGFGPGFSLNLLRRAGVVGVSHDGVGKSGAYITKAVAYVAKGAPEWMSRRNLYGFARSWAPDFEDSRRAVLSVSVPPTSPGALGSLVTGTRLELARAGYPVPPAGVMHRSEAEGFGAWRDARWAASVELRRLLGRVEAVRASDGALSAGNGLCRLPGSSRGRPGV